MSWRKFESHQAETRAVKKALAEAGIKAKVSHGSGTSWAWLEINLGRDARKHQKVKDTHIVEMTLKEASLQPYYLPCIGDCDACEKRRQLREKVIKIAQEVTGRDGEYSGRINILEQ